MARHSNSLVQHPSFQDPAAVIFSFLAWKEQHLLRATCSYWRNILHHAVFLEFPVDVLRLSLLLATEYDSSKQECVENEEERTVDGLLLLSVASANAQQRQHADSVLSARGGVSHFSHQCANFQSFIEAQLTQQSVVAPSNANLKLSMTHTSTVLTVIGKGFLKEQQNLSQSFYLSITELVLSDLPALTTIGDFFCSGNRSLEKVTLEDLPRLDTIGYGAVSDCPNLRELTLEKIPKVRKLPECTFYLLPNFAAALTWETFFRELSSVTEIYPTLLVGSGITHLEMCGLDELEILENHCFHNCPMLERAVLSDMRSLKKIETSVLSSCATLQEVVLSKLPALTRIDPCFAESCDLLQRATLSKLPQLSEVDEWSTFFWKCPRLHAVIIEDLSHFSNPLFGGSLTHWAESGVKVHLQGERNHKDLRGNIIKAAGTENVVSLAQ